VGDTHTLTLSAGAQLKLVSVLVDRCKKDVSALRIQDADDDSVKQTDDERRGTGASTQVSESAAQGVLRAVDDATAAVHKVRELSVWWLIRLNSIDRH
jgi:hypothetical protein